MQVPEILEQKFEKKLLKELFKRPVMDAKAGEDIFVEGMHVDIIPLVLKGKVRLYKITENKKEAHIYDVNPGESCVITYTTVLMDETYPARAKAIEDSKIILIDKETSEKWFKKYPSWRNFILKLYDLRLKELIQEHETTVKQKDEIEAKNNAIISSINYARRIQQALMPEDEVIKQLIPEYFIFYKPKDIVSGDFYWIKQENDRIILIVGDATGHGVPGAFMTALGIALINEVSKDFKGNAADFLNMLRDRVLSALRKHSSDRMISDGMDISLLIIYPKQFKADYAGAYSSIAIINNGQLKEIKGDKMPIGKFLIQKSFSNKTFNLDKNDVIYLYTDGFYTQLGEYEGKIKKYGKKRFLELLKRIYNEPFEEQKKILEQQLQNWKKDLNQTDDITVMAIKFNYN